jgi:hypothetical protein
MTAKSKAVFNGKFSLESLTTVHSLRQGDQITKAKKRDTFTDDV